MAATSTSSPPASLDLLIVGGGIYGLTIACDAAQRGLWVALVDRPDFGSGSSFNRLRTIHGGLAMLSPDARYPGAHANRFGNAGPSRGSLLMPSVAFVVLPFVPLAAARKARHARRVHAGCGCVAPDRNRGVSPLRFDPGRTKSSLAARPSTLSGVETRRTTGAAVWIRLRHSRVGSAHLVRGPSPLRSPFRRSRRTTLKLLVYFGRTTGRRRPRRGSPRPARSRDWRAHDGLCDGGRRRSAFSVRPPASPTRVAPLSRR